MKIATIALVAALTFVVAASAFTASITVAEAKKGEAAEGMRLLKLRYNELAPQVGLPLKEEE